MIARSGLGAGSEAGSLATTIGSTVGTIGGVLATSVGGGATIATTLGISAAAGPIGLAIGGLVVAAGLIMSALGVGEGCGPTCIQATSIVNQAEPLMLQNLQLYQSGQLDQATAISNFNQLWGAVTKACAGIPGTAGQNCVGDRAQGACHYRDASGQCWNWFVGYYQPLLQPNGMGGTVGAGQSVSTGMNVSGVTGNSGLLVGGLLAAVGLFMVAS